MDFNDVSLEQLSCRDVYDNLGMYIHNALCEEAITHEVFQAIRLQELIFLLVEKGIKQFNWNDLSLYCSGELCRNDFKTFTKLKQYGNDRKVTTKA